MKKTKSILSMACLLATGLIISVSACKKKSDDPVATPVTPAKTLNKSTLTNNKTWYNQGSSIVHVLKSNGTCGTSGSWRWVNNSDTMEIDDIGSGSFLKWKFYYNTDTEMKCRWINNAQDIEFRTTAW